MTLLSSLSAPPFDRSGFAVREGFLSRSNLAALEKLLDAHFDSRGYSEPDVPVLTVEDVFDRDPAFQAILLEAGLPTKAELRSEHGLRLCRDMAFRKRPAPEFNTPWHQDYPAFQGKSGAVILFFSLTDTDFNTIEVVPASQRLGPLAHDAHGIGAPDPSEIAKAVTFKLAPGALLFMHPHTMHLTLPNRDRTDAKSYALLLERPN